MPALSNQSLLNNQLASDWMHWGMDLVAQNSSGTLEQAIRCFDEAIALRQTLPLSKEAFFRYGLSAGWINRGDAMARLGGRAWLNGAIQSYDEALVLLKTLSLEENPLYPRRLAITWINRGNALRLRDGITDRAEAVRCFREAITVLDSCDGTGMGDRAVILAGAWINLAGVATDSEAGDSELVRLAVQKALVLVRPSEMSDLPEAELGFKARLMIMRVTVRSLFDQKPVAEFTTDEVVSALDEAMTLATHWSHGASVEMVRLTGEIFRLGCRIYEQREPRCLADYLMKSLGAGKVDRALFLDHEVIDAAHASLWTAFEKLQTTGFQKIGTPDLPTLLSDLQELRKVEEWLKLLRSGTDAKA